MEKKQNTYNEFVSSFDITVPRLDDVFDFHESTKQNIHEFAALSVHRGKYVNSRQGVREAAANYKDYFGYPFFELPAPIRIDMSISDAFQNRESVRQYEAFSLPLSTLSALFTSIDINRKAKSALYPDVDVFFRTYPSAGGLYPIECYILIFRVDGLESGIYHYCAHRNGLFRLRDLPDNETLKMITGDTEDYVEKCSALLLFTMVLKRSLNKYGRIGYRFALLEAGIMSSNVGIAATGLGLGTLFWASYQDDAVNAMLKINGREETMIQAMWLGKKRESDE